MRQRSLQNGRDAGSIRWRRQYTQRDSGSAKPGHCINGGRKCGKAGKGRLLALGFRL